jgi:hypothetical protein
MLNVEVEAMFYVFDDTRLSMAGFRRATATALFLSAALLGTPSLAAGGGAGGGGGAGSGAADGASGGGAVRQNGGADLTTCDKGQVWDVKNKKCIVKKSGVLPDLDLTEYAFALAKAERFREALDVLDTLQDPNTPRALNYRGYATRKLLFSSAISSAAGRSRPHRRRQVYPDWLPLRRAQPAPARRSTGDLNGPMPTHAAILDDGRP